LIKTTAQEIRTIGRLCDRIESPMTLRIFGYVWIGWGWCIDFNASVASTKIDIGGLKPVLQVGCCRM